MKYHTLEWLRVPGRGDMAVIEVEEPGIATGEQIHIDGRAYTIQGIEAHLSVLAREQRYVGRIVGVLVGTRTV